jgi:deoxyribodipyrimidine photolyase-like uncharacterized protein
MKELTAIDIIKKDHTCQNGEAERVLPIIYERLLDGNSLFVRQKNSLCFMTIVGLQKVEAHFYSIDKAFYVVKAVKYFINQMKSAGFKVMYVKDFSDVKMKRILEINKLIIKSSDIQDFKYMVDLNRGK